jgi:hypothetical protein
MEGDAERPGIRSVDAQNSCGRRGITSPSSCGEWNPTDDECKRSGSNNMRQYRAFPGVRGKREGMAWRTLARPGDVGQRVLEAETPTPPSPARDAGEEL